MNLLGQQDKKGGFSDSLFLGLIFLAMFYLFLYFTKDEKIKTEPQIQVPVVSTTLSAGGHSGQTSVSQTIKEELISYETEKYILVFSSQFATLTEIKLKDYKNGQGEFFNLTPHLTEVEKLPLIYKLSGYEFTRGFKVQKKDNEIIFTQTDKGLTLEKKFTFSDDIFGIQLGVKLTNKTTQAITTDAFLGWGTGLGPFVPKEFEVQYDTVVSQAFYDNILDKEVVVSKDNSLSEVANVQWLGIDNRYFFVGILPKQKGQSLVNLTHSIQGDPYSQYMEVGNKLTISAQQPLEQFFTIYIGPKKENMLSAVDSSLERISERGWFFFPLLGHFLIWIVTLIQGVVSSYGLAIMIFAILLRVVFHPLNMQSMIATARQAEMQGKVQAIKEKYTDKATQNMKIMELYKTEQVNLLKGCFPMLIQIPFFITFYQELPHLVDLAQSQFLWVKDLSSPDTLFYIDAFKNLPVLPYRFNILPIIITIATVLQMWITSKNQKSNPQMKIMIFTMPIIFLFILWNAPAALNLYWLTQTVATMATQLYFNKNKNTILEAEKNKRKNRRSKKQQGK